MTNKEPTKRYLLAWIAPNERIMTSVVDAESQQIALSKWCETGKITDLIAISEIELDSYKFYDI